MKARLAFDGGYYQKAKRSLRLEGKLFFHNAEKAEYNYRKGTNFKNIR
jgi:hypothetical protein